MSISGDEVHDAIDRWERTGLLDQATASSLRNELRSHSERSSQRLGQYVLAYTGAAVLLIAGGLFLDWAWPVMGEGARTSLLAALGVAVLGVGTRLETSTRWQPAALLMQTAAIGLVLAAYVYSERAWAPASPIGVVLGLVALVTPIVLTGRAMSRNVVMPAVNMAAALAFLAVFLERSTPLSGDAVIWTLDGVLGAAVLVLVGLLRSDPEGARHPWALNAFVTAMGGGFVLVAATAFEALDLSEEGVLAIDAWLLLSVALTLWGVHRAPRGLRRAWFERLLSLELFAWMVLGALTVFGTFDGPPEAYVLAVSGVGAAAFLHGDRHGFDELMTLASFAFLVPVWYWAVDRGGALGGVLALLGTAALLFRASGRRARSATRT